MSDDLEDEALANLTPDQEPCGEWHFSYPERLLVRISISLVGCAILLAATGAGWLSPYFTGGAVAVLVLWAVGVNHV